MELHHFGLSIGSAQNQSCLTLMVTCIHGYVREVPAADVWVGHQGGEWPITVGLIPELPLPLLIGRDRPKKERSRLPSQHCWQQFHRIATWLRKKRLPRCQPEGVSSPPTNALCIVPEHVMWEGNFWREQREDDQKKTWTSHWGLFQKLVVILSLHLPQSTLWFHCSLFKDQDRYAPGSHPPTGRTPRDIEPHEEDPPVSLDFSIYLLVVVDYITWLLEAAPLCKAKNIMRKDMLTSQGKGIDDRPLLAPANILATHLSMP